VIPGWIVPEWPAPPGVRAASTLRAGGVSPPPWSSLNLAEHVGDDPARVAANRDLLAQALGLPADPAWLEQVHGREVLRLDAAHLPARRVADGAVTARSGRVLTVLTADCLPVLFCRADGTGVGIAHAGWRGLAAGVLEATAEAMDAPPDQLLAWIGPGIGAAAYEVGDEVRDDCLAAAPGPATPARPPVSPPADPAAGSATSPVSRAAASRRSASPTCTAATGAPLPTRRAFSPTGATGRSARRGAWRRSSGSPDLRPSCCRWSAAGGGGPAPPRG